MSPDQHLVWNMQVCDPTQKHVLYRRLGLIVVVFLALMIIAQGPAHAVVYEKYLLAFPLRPDNPSAEKSRWFGNAFRIALEETVLSLKTVVFIQDDELDAIRKEYGLSDQEPDPGKMETIADDKDIAILHGTYQLQGDKISLFLSIIPERNSEARTFKVVGSTKRLDKLFANTLQKVAEILELTVTPADQKVFDIVPGTHLLSAFHSYTNAIVLLKKPAIKNNTRIKAVLYFTEALKSDAGYLSARVGRAACRINLAKTARGKSAKRYITLAKNDVDKAVRINPVDPLLLNAQAGYLMLFKKYADAKKIAEKNLALYPANHENYLLLGKIYRALKMTAEAEKILLQGLDQQGTALQKKAFHRELGLLLLKKKDKHAEVYLKEVLKLEPNNFRLYYLRATALFRLKRYLDVMTEIQKAEVLKKWRDLNLLKAETVLALGNVFYEEGDYDRAFSYASIAINIRDRHFETLLLMAKVLRKKGFRLEAKRQLEAARKLARKKHPKDHLWLGTECVAQNLKNQGAQEYVLYLKLNPKAPERRRLISLIRKLQGEIDE
ncbi:hypothetical protein K8S19_11350 [bacterium]|nr:hypothetical protein [bacterium]